MQKRVPPEILLFSLILIGLVFAASCLAYTAPSPTPTATRTPTQTPTPSPTPTCCDYSDSSVGEGYYMGNQVLPLETSDGTPISYFPTPSPTKTPAAAKASSDCSPSPNPATYSYSVESDALTAPVDPSTIAQICQQQKNGVNAEEILNFNKCTFPANWSKGCPSKQCSISVDPATGVSVKCEVLPVGDTVVECAASKTWGPQTVDGGVATTCAGARDELFSAVNGIVQQQMAAYSCPSTCQKTSEVKIDALQKCVVPPHARATVTITLKCTKGVSTYKVKTSAAGSKTCSPKASPTATPTATPSPTPSPTSSPTP
jgi:hypothetical protein